VGTGSQSCRDVYDDGVLRISHTDVPAVLVIAGEIDEATCPGLVDALAELPDEQGETHVNLAGVTYCDLTGLRAILSLAGTGSDGQDQSAKRLVLHEVPPHLRTILQVIGWDTTPGLFYDCA
jgi:ABC-type transporter Mla MlaB component